METAAELDRRRKRQTAMHKPPVYDRAALKLDRTRSAQEAGGGRAQAALALQAQPDQKWKWRGPHPRRGRDRHRASLRSRAHSRGRPLSLYAAVRRRRCRFCDHAYRAGRGINVTNTAAQIEHLRGARREGARVRAFPAADRPGGEALSKRIGSLSLRGDLRERDRAAGASILSRQDRHLRSDRTA